MLPLRKPPAVMQSREPHSIRFLPVEWETFREAARERGVEVTRWGAAALAALLLTGCAAYSDSATNGPVTVTLAEPATIAAACRTITREAGAWGCMARYPSGHVSILCPPIAECLAHEIRHALEPGWRHE